MGVGYHAPNLEAVEKKIENLGLKENITLLEWTSREDVFNIIKNSQVYISTSRYEGLPYSVIESLALGKPIVATDCDGNRDLVRHEFNGYLLNNTNATNMGNYITKILNDKNLKLRFSKNSFQFFLDNFDLSKNIVKLEQHYKDFRK